jgi:hypothetical protein
MWCVKLNVIVNLDNDEALAHTGLLFHKKCFIKLNIFQNYRHEVTDPQEIKKRK